MQYNPNTGNPSTAQMLAQVNSLLVSFREDPELITNIALLHRKIHDELTKVGFSSETADQIVIASTSSVLPTSGGAKSNRR